MQGNGGGRTQKERSFGAKSGRWTRGEFLAASLASAIGLIGAAGYLWPSASTAAPGGGHAHGHAAGDAKPGARRGFDYKGKRVEIVEDAGGADVTIDGKTVRTKRVGDIHRAPNFAFLPAHTPDELAKGLIDYEVALARDAALAGATGGR